MDIMRILKRNEVCSTLRCAVPPSPTSLVPVYEHIRTRPVRGPDALSTAVAWTRFEPHS